MPQSQPKPKSEIEVVRLVWLAIFVSVFSFLFYYRHGDLLLYGDAVAHINIARRVFDSKTPGLLQLGTVWLPLPHLLIMPFIVSKQMWQAGACNAEPWRRSKRYSEDCGVGRGDSIRRESELDLHAGHGDGRVAVSGVVPLGRGLFL